MVVGVRVGLLLDIPRLGLNRQKRFVEPGAEVLQFRDAGNCKLSKPVQFLHFKTHCAAPLTFMREGLIEAVSLCRAMYTSVVPGSGVGWTLKNIR